MDLKTLINDYYASADIMQLATVNGDQPWICTVKFAAGSEFKLYWVSYRSRRHSQEILTSPKVAVAIVKDSEHKQALQMVGTAQQVEPSQFPDAHKIYTDKLGEKPGLLETIQNNLPDGPTYWVFAPTHISFWDEVNFPDSPKQEFSVN